MCILYIYEGKTRKHAENRILARLKKHIGRIICDVETKIAVSG